MRLTIFGTGYVGLVTGACLAEAGHHVVCMDVDEAKVARLRKGEMPLYEPHLQALVERNYQQKTLEFTSASTAAVRHAEVLFVAVGTPPGENGAADLQHVLAVAECIGREMDSHKVVVVKSTVPVGTSDKVRERIAATLAARGSGLSFDVVSNPEFLKEGAAVADFQKPDRIIVGTTSEHARELMKELYEPFNRNHERTLFMDARSAELTKYAANAMLATKISFINEIAALAERLGADIEHVRHGIGSDPRIGYDFIYPGLGYGGSCFPKDVRALACAGDDVGHEAVLIKAVDAVNARQKRAMFDKVATYFGGAERLKDKTFAVWGLAFKPNTDDMREASSRVLIEALWAAGARVQAFDPVAMDETRRIYGVRGDLILAADKYAALENADALVVCTEWQQFRVPDFPEMARRMKTRLIFDGRNIYPPERMREDGWAYISIGRAPIYPRPQALEQVP